MGIILKLSFRSALRSCGAVLLSIAALLASPASAEVVREDCALLDGKEYPCVYRWSDPQRKPEAIVIAVHGMTLHGLIFDALAKHLAERGIVVLAPDLRGYGRDKKHAVAYDQSQEDLVNLIGAAKQEYPDLPLYGLGESLGAGCILFAASQEPSLVDGLILSSPAIKRRLNLVPRVLEDTAKALANPIRQVDLIPYMRKFASDDPRITNEAINDPLVRKKLTIWELLKTVQTIKPTLKYAHRIRKDMPVLVMQASDDKMLQCKAIVNLLDQINSEDQTVKWFKNRGHLILETAYLRPDVLLTVDHWLADHMSGSKPTIQMSRSAEIDAKNSLSFNPADAD